MINSSLSLSSNLVTFDTDLDPVVTLSPEFTQVGDLRSFTAKLADAAAKFGTYDLMCCRGTKQVVFNLKQAKTHQLIVCMLRPCIRLLTSTLYSGFKAMLFKCSSKQGEPSLSCACCGQRLRAAPMYQCSGGHSACAECRAAARTCGVCGRPVTDMRSFALEVFIAQMKTRCPNASHGCRRMLAVDEEEAHARECPFAGVRCPAPAASPCPWIGSPTSEDTVNEPAVVVDYMDDNDDDDHLEDLDYLESVSELVWHDLFPVPTQALLTKQIKSIVKRLNSRDDTEEEERSGSQTGVELRPETSELQLTLKEKSQLEIDKSVESPDPEVQVQKKMGLENSIRREMSLFENGGVRGYYLGPVYK
ncbi:E3 ubiquitin-protein ligase SINA-like 2 [Eumeta japonica]|uniref:E3 ubiquitin-protein ligase SINA-like 2 n=1 Tax=Eumeta variegata TaxID=151549 RepID=A0A4C1ZF71_EUMVA|nr:E3 ubiquitin-protein ligase SINA-like 2 [Eumeta japonica]